MTQILQFVENTTADLRAGRQSWRVFTLVWTVSLSVVVVAQHLLR